MIARMRDDGMSTRAVSLHRRDVVTFKSLVEGYPGLVSVHAMPGRRADERADLVVAFSAEVENEVDAILRELACEIDLAVEVP